MDDDLIDFDALIPNPCVSDRQHERFYHQDIACLEDVELFDEFWALRPHLWGAPEGHWVRARVAALEAELARRRGAPKYNRYEQVSLAKGVQL